MHQMDRDVDDIHRHLSATLLAIAVVVADAEVDGDQIASLVRVARLLTQAQQELSGSYRKLGMGERESTAFGCVVIPTALVGKISSPDTDAP